MQHTATTSLTSAGIVGAPLWRQDVANICTMGQHTSSSSWTGIFYGMLAETCVLTGWREMMPVCVGGWGDGGQGEPHSSAGTFYTLNVNRFSLNN